MKRGQLFILFFLVAGLCHAQQPPFWNDIQSFKKKDSVSFPPKNANLLIGSSSFTMWKDVQKDFPNYTIVNRGFGGSSLPDLIRYVNDIVFPYNPKQILIYCGENDFASSDTVTVKMVVERFSKLYDLIRKKLPKTPILYISMKPSPSRVLLLPKFIEANSLIKKFLARRRNTGYIDVYKEMIDDEGKPKGELFLEDNLHMNKDGYAIWKRVIESFLRK